jgi:hypothetical protein
MIKVKFAQVCICVMVFLSACKANDVASTPTLPGIAIAPTDQSFITMATIDCRSLTAVEQVIPTTSEEAWENATNGDSFEYMKAIIATIPVTIADQLSPSEFTTALFCGYLENYRSSSIESLWKLDDFQIVEVRLDDYPNPNLPNEFTATIIYSVQPTTQESAWIAGSGTLCNDGWICHKLQYVYVKRDNDYYIMAYPHTGP